MQNLSTNQKMIVGGLSIFIIIIIGYYFFTKNTKVDYSSIDVEYQNEIKSLEEKESKGKDLVIHIAGQVLSPGVVTIPSGSRIIDAIDAAGGLLEDADLTSVNLAYSLSDGQKIYIPSLSENFTVDSTITDNGNSTIVDTNFKNNTALVNINTASQTELETLPGIGPSTALKIIEYRKTTGKFSDTQDLKNVSGIGEAKFNGIKNKICI